MYAYSFASRFYKRAPLEALSLQIDLSLLRVARTLWWLYIDIY